MLGATDVEFPLIQAFSYFPFKDNHTLSQGRMSYEINLSYSNVYMFDSKGTTINDMELISHVNTIKYGLSDRITLEGHVRTILAFGGILDKFIEDFHEVFAISEGGRSKYPRGSLNYSYKDIFNHQKSLFTSSHLLLCILTDLMDTPSFTWKLRAGVGFSFGSKPGFRSDKPFLVAGLVTKYYKRFWQIEFNNHVSFFKKPSWFESEDIYSQIFLSEFKVNYRRVFAGVLIRSSPFKVTELSNHAYQAYIGYKINNYIEISIIEEFPPLDTAPDVTFNVCIKLLNQ